MAPNQLPQAIQIPGQIGKQGKYNYFAASIRVVDLLPLISFDYEDESPEARAQRVANPKRVKEVGEYINNNQDTYVFNAVTLIVRSPKGQSIQFQPVEALPGMGHIVFAEGAVIYPVDGQHRIKGWKRATGPEALANETLQCIFWEEVNLGRAQQIFHDLNFYAAKPNTSLALFYDQQKGTSQLPRSVISKIPFLERYTDLERTTVTDPSKFLFPYSAIHEMLNQHLFFGSQLDYPKRLNLACAFFEALIEAIVPWQQIAVTPEVDIIPFKQNSLVFKAVTLCALGAIGSKLIFLDDWQQKLAGLGLGTVDWSLDNSDWDGVVRFSGRLTKNAKAIEGLAVYLMSRS